MSDFCCDELNNMLYSNCLCKVDEREANNPQSIQKHSVYMKDIIRNVRIGEIYLYEAEFSQIFGKPFKFCPYCGMEI